MHGRHCSLFTTSQQRGELRARTERHIQAFVVEIIHQPEVGAKSRCGRVQKRHRQRERAGQAGVIAFAIAVTITTVRYCIFYLFVPQAASQHMTQESERYRYHPQVLNVTGTASLVCVS